MVSLPFFVAKVRHPESTSDLAGKDPDTACGLLLEWALLAPAGGPQPSYWQGGPGPN